MTQTISAQQAALPEGIAPATLTIEAGRITGVTPGFNPEADVTIADDVLLPGGVDTHVHLNEPGRTEWEGFGTGTAAARLGGVTTVLDMPLNSIPPTTTPEALATKREAAHGQLSVDLGYWGGAVPENLGHLEELWNEGVFGFKSFTSPSGVDEFGSLDPEQLRQAQKEIASFGGMHIIHAEDPAILDAAPHHSSRAYQDFLASRPVEAEARAIEHVLEGVREYGTRTHILHLSSQAGAELIAAAKAEGLPVSAETCPHYLCLAAENIPDGEGRFKCCPPIRSASQADALWQALLEGIIDIVVTDHSPATIERKTAGGGDLQLAWGGIAGLQVGYSAVLTEATRRGISLHHVAQWMSLKPAQLMGVAGKGGIREGVAADLAVWSPAKAAPVSLDELAHKNHISAWEDFALGGRITQVWQHGTPVDATTGCTGVEIFRA